MKLMRFAILTVILAGLVPSLCAQGSNGGTLYASDFAQWSLPQGSGPANGTISWPSASVCQVSSGGFTFTGPKIGRPLLVIDNAAPAHSETVIPSNVIVGPGGCSLAATMLYSHLSYSVISGTAGLQEAIDYGTVGSQVAVVALTPPWAIKGGTTSTVTSAYGNINVSIIDERTSVFQPYAWNGSAYVAVPNGGTVTNIATTFPITGGPISSTGTIGLGTVPITLGGTGATTAAGALTNLGAAAATQIGTGTSGERTQYTGASTVGPTPNVFVATPGGSLQTEYNASQCFGQSNCLIDVPAGSYSGGTFTITSGMNLVCENWGAVLTATTASADVIDVQAGATNWSIVGCTINGQSAGAPIVVSGNTYASPTASGLILNDQIENSGGTAVSIAPGYIYYAANIKIKDNTFTACGSACVGFSGLLGLDITDNYIYDFGTISASSDAFNAGGHFNQNLNISDNKAWVKSSTAFFMETGGGCSPGCGSAAVNAFMVSGSGGAGDTITFTLANAPAANFYPPPASYGVGWIEVYLSSGLPDVNWLDMQVTSVSSTQPWTVTVSYPNASQIFPASGSAAGIMMVSPVVSGFTIEKNQVYASGVSAATAFSGYFSHGNFIDNTLVAQNAGQNATPSSSTYQACNSRSGLEIEGSDWGAIGNTIVNGEINVDGYSSGPIGVVVEGNHITDSCNINSAWSAIGVSGDQGGNSGPNGPYPAKNIVISSNDINLTGAGRSSGTGHGIEIGQDNGHNGSVDGFNISHNIVRYGGGSVPNQRPIAFGGVNTSKVTGIGGTCATEPVVTLTDTAGVLASCAVNTAGNCSVTTGITFPIPYSFSGTAGTITPTWSGTALASCTASGGTGYGTVIQNGSVTDNQVIGAKSSNFSNATTGGAIGLAETATGSVIQNVTFDKVDCSTSTNMLGSGTSTAYDPCIHPTIIGGSAAWTSNGVKDTNWSASVTDAAEHFPGGAAFAQAFAIKHDFVRVRYDQHGQSPPQVTWRQYLASDTT